MNLSSTNLKILAATAIALFVIFWQFPWNKQDQQSVDLSEIALKTFDLCINAAFLSRPLSNEELAAEIISLSEALLIPPKNASFNFERQEDFECVVEIPKHYYDPKLLHERLVWLKSTRFDGRFTNCKWRLGKNVSSILSCSMESKVDPGNIFGVSFIISFESAYFWVQPRLIYDTDGRVRLINKWLKAAM